ncbi:MAG: permease-like cell division protein FtsX [Halieaceae bacterium]|nr:permease-like cell division protein FtsX [Halieaceae bacterium]
MSAGATGKGASHDRASWLDVPRAWLSHHWACAVASIRHLLHTAFTSAMTWLVIGIALALPVSMLIALDNAHRFSSRLDSPVQLSLFLDPEQTLAAAWQLQQTLEEREDVASTRLVTKEEALREFQELSGFDDILLHLEENPLPHLIVVSPADPRMSAGAAANWQSELQALPGAGRAILDMEWVQRLNSLIRLSERLVAAVGLLLTLGALLVVGNTIRLAIENRRQEIVVIKLVGGSNAFVRRPFLYTGVAYGLGGALVAWLVIAATLWQLEEPLRSLAQDYQSEFTLLGLGWKGGLSLLMAGAVLGLSGSWLSVSRHLSRIQPR